MNGRTPDEGWAREMLAHVSADCPREDWLRIAAALKAGLEDSGWPVFNGWSHTAPDRYDAADCRRAWESLQPDGKVSWGTLVHHARAGGWDPPPDTALTTQWTIREADGTPVAIHYRTSLPDGSKRTWWGRPDGTKGLGGRKARTLPLYGVELLADSMATAVCIVEGEKAADALRDAEPSVLVLGTVTGAGSSPAPEVLEPVAAFGRPVFLWPDADPDGSGVRHMHRVANRLIEAGGKAPSIIEWPEAPPKGDAADWADAGSRPPFADLTAAATGFRPKRKRQAKTLAKAPRSHSGGLPVIVATPGKRARWTREVVVALVEAGPRNDRESLYAGARAVYETHENAGDLLILREAPPPQPDASVRTPEGTLLYVPASLVAVQSLIDTAVEWYVVRKTRGGENEEVPGEIRKGDVELVIERYRHDCLDHKRPRLRVLRGIVDAPTLRADGSLLAKPGYDDTSGLYVNFNPDDWPKIPRNPSRDAARAALAKLYDLVEETPFGEHFHRAVWAAALLTVVAREYAAGNVPLFAFSANVPGAGKGTLVDLITEIAMGRGATKWAPVSAARKGDKEAEERKRIMAVALSGTRVLCIDNVKPGDPLGTPALEVALTIGEDELIGIIADRVLGETRQSEVPWRCVVMATGNNLTVVGDMGRRAVLCRLESSLQDPELRQFKHYPKLLQHARQHRSELLTAALTILIAHKHAVDSGEPDTLLPKVDSFGGWSDRIRSAVWWADPEGCDPWDGNRELKKKAQPEQEEEQAFFAAWFETFSSREVLVKDLELSCQPDGPDYSSVLADAVAELAITPPRGKAALNVRSLGMWLPAHADRPGPYILRKVEDSRKWYVERGVEAGSESGPQQAITDLLIKQEWSDEQVERALRLLNKLVKGQIVNDDRLLFGFPAYSYMENKQGMQSDAFKQAYERLPSIAERQLISIEEAIAFLLAEKYLVQADEKLGGFGTADQLSFEAARLMTAAMSAASNGEFTPEAGIIKSELVRIIERLLGRDHDAATVGDHPVSEADRDAPGDTETGDQSVPRCVGCSTTEGRIVRRALHDGRYGFACEACAVGQGGRA